MLTTEKLLRKHADIVEDFFDCLMRIVDHYTADFFQLHGIAAATIMACSSLRVRHTVANRSVQLFFKRLLRVHDPIYPQHGPAQPHPQRPALEAFLTQQEGAIPKVCCVELH